MYEVCRGSGLDWGFEKNIDNVKNQEIVSSFPCVYLEYLIKELNKDINDVKKPNPICNRPHNTV